MFQLHYDRLITFVSLPEFEHELIIAKKYYFGKTGEVFEDDSVFEVRMASFLDWFIFDRTLSNGLTPAQFFIDRHAKELSQDELDSYRHFAGTIHSLFEVGKNKDERVVVKDLFANKSFEVFERRKLVGVEAGDLIEARLISTASDKLMFAAGFCYHPRGAKKKIIKLVKAHKKASLPPEELLFRLAYLRLKFERYKHVDADAIYENG